MLVSIIIPVYNSERTVERAVLSVVKSVSLVTDDYEVLCIDDGSTDSSLRILNSLSARNKKIFVFHQENGGVSSARNRGLEAAKGEYIAFNDSDDEWTENHFSVLKNIFEKFPFLMCISGNHDVDMQRIPILKRIDKNLYRISIHNELAKNYYSPPATMLKKSIVAGGIRFNNNMHYAEDENFFCTVVYQFQSAFLNQKVSQSITGKRRFGESGLSGNLQEMEKGELFNLKYAYKHFGIGFVEYIFLVLFSKIKYVRRIVVTKLRK